MSVVLLLAIAFSIMATRKQKNDKSDLDSSNEGLSSSTKNNNHSILVGDFYDRHNDAFLKIYGDTIQAFRTVDVTKLLQYQGMAMALKEGMRILDAGCGICGPAIYFAKHFGVTVDAVTISANQVSIAQDKINESGLSGMITVSHGNYHELPSLFNHASYDVVYFLESFGHSNDKQKAINASWEILKPGGMLYIKDLFAKESIVPGQRKTIEQNIQRINEAYHYQVSDLSEVLSILRQKGFILSALKTIDIPLEEFENLTISNEFQTLTGINRIDDLQSYVFPVDFFELVCIKPWYDPSKGSSRYFLQNLYYLQVLTLPENEL